MPFFVFSISFYQGTADSLTHFFPSMITPQTRARTLADNLVNFKWCIIVMLANARRLHST